MPKKKQPFKARISTVDTPGGKRVIVEDPRTGNVVCQYQTTAAGAAQDVGNIKRLLDMKKYRTEVTEV